MTHLTKCAALGGRYGSYLGDKLPDNSSGGEAAQITDVAL